MCVLIKIIIYVNYNYIERELYDVVCDIVVFDS